jgi:hypothetical protein
LDVLVEAVRNFIDTLMQSRQSKIEEAYAIGGDPYPFLDIAWEEKS